MRTQEEQIKENVETMERVNVNKNNSLDRQYKELLEHIIRFGNQKSDRTGTGTKSIFSWELRHNMKEGFPLITTKKMYWKGIVTELLWFLRGETNIKYLIENDCHIWTGDARKKYNTFMLQEARKITWVCVEPATMTHDEFTNKIKTDNEFAKQWGELGPIYGKQWRKWKKWCGKEVMQDFYEAHINEIDQIQNLINDLKNNPDSRRLIVEAWNVAEIDNMVLPPCHYGFQVYTRELSLEERLKIADGMNKEIRQDLYSFAFNNPSYVGIVTHSDDEARHLSLNDLNIPKRAISLKWNQRSVDTFLGLPFNIASYGLLLCILGEIVNMVPEELIGSLGDVHLYNNHIEQAKEQMTRIPYDLPTLNINTEFWAPGTDEGCGMGAGTYNPDFDGLVKSIEITDFQIENYQSHPAIKAKLSN
jgi:thymidylate synthase